MAMGRFRTFCGAMVMLAAAASAAAQGMTGDPTELAEQLARVERELREIKAQMGPEAAGAATPGVSQNPMRYNDLEESLRRVTGQVEELSFQVRRLQDQYATFQRDTQFRLGALEGGAPASLPAAAALPAADGAGAQGPGGPAPMTLNPKPPAAGAGKAPGPGVMGTLPANADPALAGAPASGTPEDQYKAAQDLLLKGQYPEAQKAFRAFATANPKHDFAAPAQYFAAEIDFVQKNYPGAAQGFTSVLRGYPKSPRAPDAMLKLGLSLIQAGDKKNGCLTLGAIRQKFPGANTEIFNRAQRARTQFACG